MKNEYDDDYNADLEKTPEYKTARKRVAKAYLALAEIHKLEKDIYTNEYTETLDFQISYKEAINRICDELGICPVEFEHNTIYMPIG